MQSNFIKQYLYKYVSINHCGTGYLQEKCWKHRKRVNVMETRDIYDQVKKQATMFKLT